MTQGGKKDSAGAFGVWLGLVTGSEKLYVGTKNGTVGQGVCPGDAGEHMAARSRTRRGMKFI